MGLLRLICNLPKVWVLSQEQPQSSFCSISDRFQGIHGVINLHSFRSKWHVENKIFVPLGKRNRKTKIEKRKSKFFSESPNQSISFARGAFWLQMALKMFLWVICWRSNLEQGCLASFSLEKINCIFFGRFWLEKN